VWKAFTGELKRDSETFDREAKSRAEAKLWNAEREVAAAMESPTKAAGIPIKSNFNLTAAKHKRYSATGNIKLANAIGLHDQATATAIRNIESSAMEREEEYRRDWQAERGIGVGATRGIKGAIFQGTPFAASGSPAPGPGRSPAPAASPSPRHDAASTPRGDGRGMHGTPSSAAAQRATTPAASSSSSAAADMSLDAAIAYLSSSRRIQLADRYVRKDYFWKLNSDTTEGREVFVLRWRDLDSDSVAGHLFATDIQSVVFPKNNSNLLEISVGTAPRPLVGTGGRAVVTLLFPSEVECKKYGKALMTIQRK
jgi:hypothetical protein